jgi:hypothetical protein
MGEQVANNTESQYRTSLVEKDGKYYAVTDPIQKRYHTRRIYSVWYYFSLSKILGNEKGSLELVEHLIKDQEKLLQSAKERLDNLTKLHSEISDWKEK